MSNIVVDVQATSTVIGWFAQMWPMIVVTAGGLGGILRWAAKRHTDLEEKFHKCDKERELDRVKIAELEGGHKTLLSLLGMQLTTKITPKGSEE